MRLHLPPSRALLAGLALLLAGCKGEPAPEAESAAGDAARILPGSISDEMIPLDELRSSAPPAAPAPGEGGSIAATSSAATMQDGAETDAAPDADDAGSAPVE